MLGLIVARLLEELSHRVAHPLIIVETGTLYIDHVESETDSLMYRSTLAIADWVKRSGAAHQFHSIDYDRGHIETSYRTLATHGLDGCVIYHCGDSARLLEDFSGPIDFALLDSDVDPEIILREFQLVSARMRSPGLVVIDDIFKFSEGVNKGRLALPYAASQGWQYWGLDNQAAGVAFGAAAEHVLRQYQGAHVIEEMA